MEQNNSKKNSDLLTGLLNMAEAMLVSGSEITRVEDTIARMGLACGAEHMNVFVITSCIIVTMGMPDGEELTQTRRVMTSGGTDFIKIERFNELSRRCCADPIAPETLEEEVRAIETSRPSPWTSYLGSVLAAGGFTMFFGGTLWDGGMAALFALAICWFQERLLPISMNQMSFNLLCSVIVGVATSLCAGLLPILHLDKILIGCIMLLIPGIALTNAVRNVLVGNTISGLMRLVEALLWAAALALGFMAAMFFTGGAYAMAGDASLSAAAQLFTAGVGAMGFSLMFNVRRNLLPLAVLGGVLDWGVYMIAASFFGETVFLSSVAAAAFATVYSEAMARVKKAPSTVFYIPALVPLIPGGSLFYTMSCAVGGQWDGVGSFGSSTLYCALGIAVGMSLILSVDFTLRKLLQMKTSQGERHRNSHYGS
ncbi:MAG: threonine/serine exporter family protein [Firmicutes bacterium]|nr:threonine/serine exporter family protein [Bacillota bacterium]